MKVRDLVLFIFYNIFDIVYAYWVVSFWASFLTVFVVSLCTDSEQRGGEQLQDVEQEES